MKNFLYNNKIRISIRIFSSIGVLILILAEINILKNFFNDRLSFKTWEILISNFFIIGIFVFIFIYPQKLTLISIACFFYAIDIISHESANPMGILMFNLGIVILMIRGFFKNHSKVKIFTLLIILVALLFSRLRFSLNAFIESLTEDLGFSFVFFLGIFFAYGYASRNAPEEKILNIAKYEGLKESDAEMLRRVLDNQQYKVIAIDLQKSEGTIRNRLNKVYDILGVADRVGFITTFTGYELIYKPEIEITENQVAEAAAQSKPQQN